MKPRLLSVAILALLGGAILFVSFASARQAYSGADYDVGPVKLSELAVGREPVSSALRGMRATAAAYAAAFSVLLLAIVLVPYRRGEGWAFWALLAGVLVFAMIYMARTLLLGSWRGVGVGALQAGIALAALAVGRFERLPGTTAPSPSAPPPPPAPSAPPPPPTAAT
jgi:hypothetical protein